MFKEYNTVKTFMGRLPKGTDLLTELTEFLEKKGIKSGTVKGIGAIEYGVVGFYNQLKKEYIKIDIQKPMEVLGLIGNVSLKEGRPFPHCHVVLGDEKGDVKGGHLMEGCRVFAFEFVIKQFEGSALVRGFDEETRLPLWQFKE
jgi:predicted DNA-binding protein with PD1-like motif